MSLSKTLRALSVLAISLLSGCGFRPLYGPQLKTTQDLSNIKVMIIADRDGQNLRNHLLDLLNPYGVPCHPEYILDTKLTTGSVEVGVRRDATTSRKELVATAFLNLRNIESGQIVLTKVLTSKNTYTAMDTNYYTNVVTEDYAKEEAIRDLSYKIQLILAEYFGNQTP
ncbi:hypothetical protein Bealeia1_00507 [Candidatus Bealeia paramacronuclearis]|uniref:LPS-assembly lipoprotein LptE n=1 Tax=Candidatus Bealeia paramacronuclearis TaxID=1921001 RepID=A0ABZ2C3U0_9PROT|nr:hypothetical protein [Candidatus Bealeia paramacronuclearis]